MSRFANTFARRQRFMWLLVLIGSVLSVGCRGAEPSVRPTIDLGLRVELLTVQTVEGLGAQQGLDVREGMVYLFGDDRRAGVIRQYRFHPQPQPRLEPTGVEIRLRRRGEEMVTHPTGLTFHPEHGTFLGDTVRQRGIIHHIDFDRMLDDRSLENAVLNSVLDDLAVNGTRPEFVRYQGRWLIATSDYGPSGNEVRLYDPRRLKTAIRTSDPGVLVASWPCGPFVQSLHWIDPLEVLVLVQNITPGLGWRLTFVRLEPDTDLRRFKPIDLDPEDELEGFHLLDDGVTAIFNSAMRVDNLRIGRLFVPPELTAGTSR